MNRRTHANCRRRGFTLMEVLATMVLMGIVIPAAMRGVSLGVATASFARHKAQAATLAETKLAELVTLGDWQLAANSGDFAPDFPGYRWQLETAARAEIADVTELALTVTWVERAQPQSLTVSTLVYASGATLPTSAPAQRAVPR